MLFIEENDEKRIASRDYTGEASIVILTNPEREILLLQRDDIPTILYPGYWTVPGGMKEESETPEETAVRELLEETGCEVTAVKFFAQTVDTDGRGELISVFEARTDKDVSELRLGEGTDMRFVAFSDVATLRIIPFAGRILEAYERVNV
ncbi:MAG: NUDIX domain-containing protein [Alphaproteobacteria bacterium]|nr:NUDIX domain-containing protein [Alphaproteobacteria bacterium]